MNIYIKNHEEIKAICAGKNDEGRKYDVNVGLDIYDNKHDLTHDEKARAEYKQFCSLPLSVDEKKLLGL